MSKSGSEFSGHSRRAKHALLANYLPAWATVLGRVFDKLRFIDGFANSGWYIVDEEEIPGSPLVAIEAFHKALSETSFRRPDVECIFIEKEKKLADDLKRNIKDKSNVPSWISTEVIHGTFAAEIAKIPFNTSRSEIVPTLVFIDPWGPTGFPISSIRRILGAPSSEVLVNLMWTRTGLNLAKGAMESTFNEMLETEEWRDLRLLDADRKKVQFAELFMQSLRDRAKAKIVRAFEVYKGKQLEYWLIFATNESKGWLEMKRAMWKVDGADGTRFLDTTDPRQEVLFEPEPKFWILRKQLKDNYVGKGPVPVEDILNFVLDDTSFLPTHVKKQALAPMKAEGEIKVTLPSGKNRGFPDGTLIEFLEAPMVTFQAVSGEQGSLF